MTAPSDLPIERRQQDLVGISSAKTYLFSALGLTVFMVLVFVAILITHMLTRPDQPLVLPTGTNYVAWFVGAIIVALFAGAGINVVNVLNGHQATLMRAIGEKEHAKGVVEGLRENPSTNIS